MIFQALLLVVLGCMLGACKSQDDPFLPLPALCPDRSEAICSARSFTCEDDDVEGCLRREAAQCEEQLDAFEAEERLSYDSVAASRVRSDEQAALDSGDAPFVLARYFAGGLAIDAECERDSQCETGSCGAESGVCEDAPESTLCESE